MSDDQLMAALRRFGEGEPHAHALAADAHARIEARMNAAFDAERMAPQASVIADIVTVEQPVAAGRRWFAALTAAAAAIAVLVVALVVLRPDGPEVPADDPIRPIQPVPVALLEPGTRWELATGSDADASGDGGAVRALVTVRVDGDMASPIPEERVVGGTTRISTGDAPPLQYLGSVRFVVDSFGSVQVPLILLDPERNWVDCEATVDVTTAGRATCGSDSVEYQPRDTTTANVDTPVGQFEATGTLVDWSVNGSADQFQTTIWSAHAVGPVRIDVGGDAVRTYELTTFDRPAPGSITQPTGD